MVLFWSFLDTCFFPLCPQMPQQTWTWGLNIQIQVHFPEGMCVMSSLGCESRWNLGTQLDAPKILRGEEQTLHRAWRREENLSPRPCTMWAECSGYWPVRLYRVILYSSLSYLQSGPHLHQILSQINMGPLSSHWLRVQVQSVSTLEKTVIVGITISSIEIFLII